jgi:hypothetical protein
MAKNNYEFKPDRERPDLLSRLYLTQKQRQSLLKWTLYSLILLGLSVLRDSIAYDLRILGAPLDPVPCAIFTICVMEGSQASAPFALIASLFYLFSGAGYGYQDIPVMTFCALGAAIVRQSYLQKGFSATVLCAVLAMVVYKMTMFLWALVLGQTFPARALVALTTAGVSSLVIPLLHPVFAAIGRIGGESWKE